MDVESSKSRKIAIVGAYPPPIGGNSVHIERLAKTLMNEGSEVKVFDVYGQPSNDDPPFVNRFGPPNLLGLFRVIRELRRAPYQVIHFHASAMSRFLIAGLVILGALPYNATKILTIHSGSFAATVRRASFLQKMAYTTLLERFDTVVAVSDEVRIAINELAKVNVEVIPAFLPASGTIDASWRAEIRELRKKYSRMIVSSGYGIPLYGYEHIIEALAGMKEKGPETLLVLFLYNNFDEAYVSRLEKLANGVANVLIFRERTPQEFNYALTQADFYVRATHRDGDAVAIREANAAGARVIASDVVTRPIYCELFPLEDIDQLRALLSTNTLRSEQTGDSQDQGQEFFQRIKAVYHG